MSRMAFGPVPNRDPILHHVYAFSPAKPFEIKLNSGRSPQEIVFDRPGVVVRGCNIHDWMTAYVVAVPTPSFGVTLEAAAERPVAFTFDLQPRKPRYKPPLDRLGDR